MSHLFYLGSLPESYHQGKLVGQQRGGGGLQLGVLEEVVGVGLHKLGVGSISGAFDEHREQPWQ